MRNRCGSRRKGVPHLGQVPITSVQPKDEMSESWGEGLYLSGPSLPLLGLSLPPAHFALLASLLHLSLRLWRTLRFYLRPPGILCGQVPADWWVPDQLPARKGGKERMATTPHPLPRINWRLCRGKHSIDMQTGPYPHPSVQARWEILGENFIYPT